MCGTGYAVTLRNASANVFSVMCLTRLFPSGPLSNETSPASSAGQRGYQRGCRVMEHAYTQLPTEFLSIKLWHGFGGGAPNLVLPLQVQKRKGCAELQNSCKKTAVQQVTEEGGRWSVEVPDGVRSTTLSGRATGDAGAGDAVMLQWRVDVIPICLPSVGRCCWPVQIQPLAR